MNTQLKYLLRILSAAHYGMSKGKTYTIPAFKEYIL